MSRKKFFTWEGHVVYCKMLVLVGAPFHARKKWWGYEVRLGEYVHGGEPADNWWKQLWCRHRRTTSRHTQFGELEKHCADCNLQWWEHTQRYP